MKNSSNVLIILLLATFSNIAVAQPPSYGRDNYYRPMQYDKIFYRGITKVEIGPDNVVYGRAKFEFTGDQGNGPYYDKEKKDLLLGWITKFFVPISPTSTRTRAYNTIQAVDSNDKSPGMYKTYSDDVEPGVSYLWLPATSNSGNIYQWDYSGCQLYHRVAYFYKKGPLMWELASHIVKMDVPSISHTSYQ